MNNRDNLGDGENGVDGENGILKINEGDNHP